jgi:hypothetical protein
MVPCCKEKDVELSRGVPKAMLLKVRIFVNASKATTRSNVLRTENDDISSLQVEGWRYVDDAKSTHSTIRTEEKSNFHRGVISPRFSSKAK